MTGLAPNASSLDVGTCSFLLCISGEVPTVSLNLASLGPLDTSPPGEPRSSDCLESSTPSPRLWFLCESSKGGRRCLAESPASSQGGGGLYFQAPTVREEVGCPVPAVEGSPGGSKGRMEMHATKARARDA